MASKKTSKPRPLTLLKRASAAVKRGDDHTALVALLEHWRAAPTRRVAGLIGALSERVGADRPRPSGKRAAREAAWHATADAGDPADIQPLLETMTEGTSAQALGRARRLAEMPDDPRISGGFLGWLQTAPFRTRAFAPFGRLAIDVLERSGDPRLADAMAFEHDGELQVDADSTYMLYEEQERRLAAAYHAACAARPLARTQAAVADELERAISACATSAASARRSPEALLAQIRETPSDDAPRLVYADLLQEAGDPRGELIALQLGPQSAASRRRQKQLIGKHGRRWLGPLAPLLIAHTFERGFLAAATLKSECGRKLEGLLDAPQWATVERLDVNKITHYAVADLIARLPALAELRGVKPNLIVWLKDGKLTCRARRVTYRHDTAKGARRHEVTRCGRAALMGLGRCFPDLRHLTLDPINEGLHDEMLEGWAPKWLRSKGVRGLETLSTFEDLSALAVWLEWLDPLKSPPRLELSDRPWHLALEREKKVGWRVTARPRGKAPRGARPLMLLAEAVEAIENVDIRLDVDAPKKPTPAQRRRLESAASVRWL